MDIHITKYNLPKDQTRLLMFLHENIGELFGISYGYNYDAETLDDMKGWFKEMTSSNTLYVAYSDNIPIGFIIGISTISEKKNIFYIQETVTRPEYRRMEVNKRLREYMITDLSPNIIFGGANNPKSVISRAITSDKFGYSTYWCNECISENRTELSKEQINNLSIKLLKIFEPESISQYQDGCYPFKYYSDTSPKTENNIIPKLEPIFMKLLRYSETVHKSCLGVLVSIK